MYSAPLKKTPFQPDPSVFRHESEREEIVARLKENAPPPLSLGGALPLVPAPEQKEEPKSLANLIDLISPEDSALVALIVFLLCDNTENDVVLLGILLYILLSK